ncbi:hypothetical protein [Nonomuraea sp. 10N515B]
MGFETIMGFQGDSEHVESVRTRLLETRAFASGIAYLRYEVT